MRVRLKDAIYFLKKAKVLGQKGKCQASKKRSTNHCYFLFDEHSTDAAALKKYTRRKSFGDRRTVETFLPDGLGYSTSRPTYGPLRPIILCLKMKIRTFGSCGATHLYYNKHFLNYLRAYIFTLFNVL